MADSNPWNAAEIALIRQLWAADWSAGKIAKELGSRTRNAVIGFADRNRDICPQRGASRVPLVRLRSKSLAPKLPPPPPAHSNKSVSQSAAKADLYRMLRRAVLNTGGRP